MSQDAAQPEKVAAPGANPSPGEDPAAFRVLTEIGLIDKLATAALERALPDEMSLAQFHVLHHFARFEGAWTPLGLARALHVSKGAMTNTLKKLEAGGLVAVAPDPADGRGKRVRITEAGLKARNSAIARATPVLRAMIKTFGEDHFAAALPFLSELRGYLASSRRSRSSDIAQP
ncbi:MAG: MarR family winged helix-turn-helix transcriptional regulator [Parvularculaceae bacterium]